MHEQEQNWDKHSLTKHQVFYYLKQHKYLINETINSKDYMALSPIIELLSLEEMESLMKEKDNKLKKFRIVLHLNSFGLSWNEASSRTLRHPVGLNEFQEYYLPYVSFLGCTSLKDGYKIIDALYNYYSASPENKENRENYFKIITNLGINLEYEHVKYYTK